MRIEHLHLDNFRCFDAREFFFADGFTLPIGANATGKTAILDALAVAAGAALTEVPDASSRLIRRVDVRRTSFSGAEVGGIEEHYPARVAVEGTFDGQSLSWQREFRSAKSHTTHRETRSIRNAMHRLMERGQNGGEAIFPYIGYYGTGRLWLEQRTAKEGGVDPGEKISRYGGYRHCLTPRSSTRDLVRRIKRLTLIQAQRGARLETLTSILDAATNCVEDAASASFDFDDDDVSITFESDLRVPFRMLSDGQRGMAALAADIAMRCTILNPHLNGDASRETPGVVLIDELDLHLHPRWQRRVVDDLRRTFPRIQFVATSHSPFIIQSMADRVGVINLDASDEEPSAISQRSIEDVAEDIMRVQQPQRSRRFLEMSEAAEAYFRALENVSDDDAEGIQALRERFDQLRPLFADNPAYAAFLRMHAPPAESDR